MTFNRSGRSGSVEMKWERMNKEVHFLPISNKYLKERREKVNAEIQRRYFELEPKFREAFHRMDKNGDNDVSKTEFSQIVGKATRHISSGISNKQLAEVVKVRFDLLDLDRNNRISWDEFWGFFQIKDILPNTSNWTGIAALASSFGVDCSEFIVDVTNYLREESNLAIRNAYIELKPQFEELFKKYDVNNDGAVDFEEFARFVGGVLRTRISIKLTEKEIKDECSSRFQQLDINGDGRIDWDEFWLYFTSDEMIPDVVTWPATVEVLKSWGVWFETRVNE